MATPEDISHLMLIMSAVYPSYTLETQTIEIYTRLLADIPIDALDAAAKDIMTTSTFFPSIAEWRRAALNIAVGVDKIPSEFEAWEEIRQQVAEHGGYSDTGPAEFSHELILRAIDCIGWDELCSIRYKTVKENEWIRSNFLKVFCSLRDRELRNLYRLPDVTRAAEALIEGRKSPAKLIEER